MVNTLGERFVDEGEDFQVYTYAKTGRRILAQPGHIAFQIFDQKTVPLLRSNYMRSRPVVANSVDELAAAWASNRPACAAPSTEFNKAAAPVEFDFSKRDGKSHHRSKSPTSPTGPSPIDSPPYQAYAVACGITFTYGGTEDRSAVPGADRG